MKIEGANLRDILVKMPWQYKIVVVFSLFFILYTLIYIPYTFLYLRFQPKLEASTPVLMGGILRPVGVLDPSLAADKSGTVWMAFTSQERPPYGDASGVRELFNVRLASMKDGKNCKEWMTQLQGFEGKSDSIIAPDGRTVLRTGAWRLETPSLVYDPDDPGKEWKLFAYKYFWANDPKSFMSVAQRYGVIVYKYASDPTGDWSTEQWLFSPAAGYPPPPYQGAVLLHLNRLDPSLQNVTTYARPSVIYKDGLLVMTLSAFTNGTGPDRIIMIASANHGRSWRYVGTVLQQSDILALDTAAYLTGATLLQQAGKVYLAAVLENARQGGAGTFLFGFDDFSKGRLQRDAAKNMPFPLKHVPLQGLSASSQGGGIAAYSDACNSGMLVTVRDSSSEPFKIYRTRFKPFENAEQGEK